MNCFNAIGRIGKGAVTRFTQGGEPVTGWSLAVDSGFGDKKQTLWFDCSLWGKRGEKVCDYLKKGAQIGVTGEVGTREHEGKTYLQLRVSEVTLVGGKPQEKTGGGGTSPPSRGDEPFPEDDVPFISPYSTY